jgi:hypothetical protein
MCEAAQKKSTQFRPNLGEKAKTNDNFVRSPTMDIQIDKFYERQAEKIGTVEYSKKAFGITINDIFSKRSNYISMLKPPEISGSFSKKLIMGPEIKELLSNDIHFRYILFNMLKILNNRLDEHGSPGRVEVALETDEDNPKWKHADITVRLDDDSLGSEIWREASKDAKDFYRALEVSKIIPSETIRIIHKFIYIIVD